MSIEKEDLSPIGSTSTSLNRPGPWIIGSVVALCLVIGINLVLIVNAPHRNAPHSGGSDLAAVSPTTTLTQSAPTSPPNTAETIVPIDGDAIVEFEYVHATPSTATERTSRTYKTVQEAAERSCSTVSVKGLSKQIIAQGRCIDPNAFAELPDRANLVIGSQVFGYLQAGARRHLLRALDAHPHQVLTLNSALRTLAQQYLVWRWGMKKSCGVQLAAAPGKSNHERGLAIDVSEPLVWRKALESQNFVWMGKSDRVHFDFANGKSSAQRTTDVLAFQKLWNLNHPDKRLAETGRFDSKTQGRLSQAPAGGFSKGASCAHGRSSP